MAECPNCERYKNSASLWRNVAYRVTGYPLPWSPDDQLLQRALKVLEEVNKLSVGKNAICLPAEIDGAIAALKARLEEK